MQASSSLLVHFPLFPFPNLAGVTVFEVLTGMIYSKELFGPIAGIKLMNIG